MRIPINAAIHRNSHEFRYSVAAAIVKNSKAVAQSVGSRSRLLRQSTRRRYFPGFTGCAGFKPQVNLYVPG